MTTFSLFDIYKAVQATTQSINGIYTLLQTFPRTTASSTQAPQVAGSISFSSSLATGFILFQSSSGATVKIATYSNP